MFLFDPSKGKAFQRGIQKERPLQRVGRVSVEVLFASSWLLTGVKDICCFGKFLAAQTRPKGDVSLFNILMSILDMTFLKRKIRSNSSNQFTLPHLPVPQQGHSQLL